MLASIYTAAEVEIEAQRIKALCPIAEIAVSENGLKLTVSDPVLGTFLVFNQNPLVIGNVDRLIAILSPDVRNLYLS